MESLTGAFGTRVSTSASPLLFVNAALLCPEERMLHPGGWLRVEQGRVAALGRGRPAPDKTAVVIDCGGRTVMPGLVDCHVVITAPPDVPPDPVLLARLRRMLASGFTTARVEGNAGWWLREAIERRLLVGPRLLASGAPVSVGRSRTRFRADAALHNAHRCACCWSTAGLDGAHPVVADARQEVRTRIWSGADHLLLDCGPAGQVGAFANAVATLAAAAISAAAHEAACHGRPVVAIAHSVEAIMCTVNAGARAIIHGTALDQAAAAHMARQASVLIAAAGDPSDDWPTPAFRVARRAGVGIAFGTGARWESGGGAAEAMIAHARYEAPIEIIRAATTVAAKALRMEGRVGTLSPGAFADLLIVEGDPTQDLGLLGGSNGTIRAVFKDGVHIVAS